MPKAKRERKKKDKGTVPLFEMALNTRPTWVNLMLVDLQCCKIEWPRCYPSCTFQESRLYNYDVGALCTRLSCWDGELRVVLCGYTPRGVGVCLHRKTGKREVYNCNIATCSLHLCAQNWWSSNRLGSILPGYHITHTHTHTHTHDRMYLEEVL